MQGLILEGLATVPVQRLKLEALRERLQEILFNIDDGESETLYGREFFFGKFKEDGRYLFLQ